MSDERETEQAGAPIEPDETTETQVQAAVGRATEQATDGTDLASSGAPGDGTAPTAATSERPVIAPVVDAPSAGEVESPSDIFVSQPPISAPPAAAVTASVISEQVATPAHDGEIRIDANHPMAALYMQSPMPPEIKGNRAAGALIALLATVAFAAIYAGALALWQAPNFPPSTYLNEGLLPWVLNWGFVAASIGFFISLVLLVLVSGRAGWWAYVLGGLPVAVLVWGFTLAGYALSLRLEGEKLDWSVLGLLGDLGLFVPVIAAALVAREVTIWFGAWIGARGRKVTKQNADALAEYEDALAEVQAK